MQDEEESDEDVEIIHVKKKMKKEEVDDYSHFVAVYDIDNDSELLEERHHDGRSERPATTTTTSVSTNSTSEDDCGESYRCPICLQSIVNATLPDACIHQFCFICILQWSQLTRSNPTCPICKQPFTSLIHSMTSSKEFRVHYLEAYPTQPSKYNSNNNNNNNNNNNARTSQQHITTQTTSITRNASQQQPFKTKVDHSNALRNEMYSDILMLRRAVYSRKLRAIPQSYHTFSQNPQLTPRQIKPDILSKIRPWITRELTAITGLDDVDVLTSLVISLITKSDIHSAEVHKALEEFLRDDVDVFVHELVCFACSSHRDMTSYDKYVRYDKPATT